MANTAKALYRGAATTNTGTVLYTVPASTTSVITNIVVVNTNTSAAATYTLALDGVSLFPGTTIPAGGIVTVDVKQVLTTTKTITGGASAATVNFHISGMEIA
jgi:hypothetical protein